jgi:FMN phosphatase YigB (HAD superfamily)
VDDISGAAAFGMRTILITGSRAPGSLKTGSPVPDHPTEPDARISGLAEVLGLVDRWSGAAET